MQKGFFIIEIFVAKSFLFFFDCMKIVANYLFDYFELNNRKILNRPRLLIVGYKLVENFPKTDESYPMNC